MTTIPLQEYIASADTVLVFAGAGMSADSGLHTFIQAPKEWKKKYQTLMTRHAFETDREMAWEFYDSLYTKYMLETKPHQGYYDLLEQLKEKAYFVVTSNTDMLFERAGFDTNRIHHVHGKVEDLQCILPCHSSLYKYSEVVDKHCQRCGRSLRPNTFLFDDALERRIVGESGLEFLEWVTNAKGTKAIVLEIGVGAEGLHSHAAINAKQINAKHILINPQPSIFSIQSNATIYQIKAIDMFQKSSKGAKDVK